MLTSPWTSCWVVNFQSVCSRGGFPFFSHNARLEAVVVRTPTSRALQMRQGKRLKMHPTVFENKGCTWRRWSISHLISEVYVKLWMAGSYSRMRRERFWQPPTWLKQSVCSPEVQSFFIYYFSSVIYKTSQQHKYPTWKAYCILFKIVVLLRTSRISWTLKTEFASQCSLVLIGRFILTNAD